MSFLETIVNARAHLERVGRVSLRALQREFELDDEMLEELVEELVDIQEIAVREGRALTWKGGGGDSAAAPPLVVEARERTPADYTPKHLADKILQSKTALEGERKQVTVMFADVKGSMELAAQLDAEVWHGILERFFEILAEGVHRFEGTINQYTGDGIMALFGAPIAHEDHAQRACYAALHLQGEIARYATEVKREHGLGFSTRMGLNSGDVVVGKIGDDLRMDYTAQGQTVGLAQRMESLASPDSCYLTAATAAIVGGYFELEDLGEFKIKGVATAVEVRRLCGTGSARTRFDISRARGLSRFVGRASDLRTLEDATEQTSKGNGQVVGVVAEAGTGKSRLCFEFLERCRARGIQVFEGHAVAHGRNIPLLPILEVFRAFFGITQEDDDRGAREKIAGRMVLLDSAFAEALPLLFDFLGVADPQNPAPQLDPEARQRQLLAVMRQVIQSVSEDQPTVTLIEDLHWMDEASGDFLAHMVEAREGSRNLLLLNFRPEYNADWMQQSWYRQIPLTPLGEDAIAELLSDLLGTHSSLAALAKNVYTRTGGNPFFTEEVAQTLIESGHLEGTRGAYQLVTPIEKLEVPTTVQAILSARIDRLPEREKRLLQVAAVIGKDFSEPLLAEVAALPANELKEALAALRRGEFLHEQAVYPVIEYSFKHPLTQEVSLGSQLRERRRAVHAAVAKAIERRDAERLDESAALLAHHHEEAGDPLVAARWHRRAAEWVSVTDLVAANQHWSRLRKLLQALPNDREAAELGIAACKQLLSTAWRFDPDVDETNAILDEGQRLAKSIGDTREQLLLSIHHARTLLSVGEVTRYLEACVRNERIAEEMGDEESVALASMWVIDAYAQTGGIDETIARTEAWLARFPRHNPTVDSELAFTCSSVVMMFRGYALSMGGRLAEGFAEYDRTLRFSEEDGSPELAFYLNLWAADSYYRAGEAELAAVSARRVEEIGRKLGEFTHIVRCLSMVFGIAHLAAGRVDDAIVALREALALFAHGERQSEGWIGSLLAETHLLSGDLSAAQSAAERSIAFCQRSQRDPVEAQANGILARVLLRRDGRPACDAAGARLDKAAALIERSGATTLTPALCEWRAELATMRGDDSAHDRLMREAREGYEAIGAPRHAARLASEME
jgi:adenylate cyclase